MTWDYYILLLIGPIGALPMAAFVLRFTRSDGRPDRDRLHPAE